MKHSVLILNFGAMTVFCLTMRLIGQNLKTRCDWSNSVRSNDTICAGKYKTTKNRLC